MKHFRKPKVYHYSRKNFIMTDAEQHFFKMLFDTFGQEYYIFPQVHLSALLDEHLQGQNWMAARVHIERKSVDYILCDKTSTRTLVAIELDDWSHKLRSRRWRDQQVEAIFREAGVPLARFYNYQTLSQDVLEHKIREKIAEGEHFHQAAPEF